MKTESIQANVLRVNPDYVRVNLKKDHIALMIDKLKESKGVWPFPSISAQPIPISEEKLIKEGFRYYIIDGHHRVAAAVEAGVQVQAIIHSGLTKQETICMQVKQNIENGLSFDYGARKRAVELMTKEGMKQVEISAKTGLPKYTVSRILSGQPVAGTEADGRKAGPAGGKKPFNVDHWEKLLGKVLVGWEKNRKKISKAKGFTDALAKALDAVGDAIAPEEGKE